MKKGSDQTKMDMTLIKICSLVATNGKTSITFLYLRPKNGGKLFSDFILQPVSWSLAEFRHNKIVQSPHENYFNVCRQHKEK